MRTATDAFAGAGIVGVDGSCGDTMRPMLDLLGQARLWFAYAGEVEARLKGTGRDEDQLAFRRDARFMPLAERLGLVDYWIATDKWPDFCSEPDLPYDCRAAARAARAHAVPPVVSTGSTMNPAAAPRR